MNQTRTEKQMRAAALRHAIYFFSLNSKLFWDELELITITDNILLA